MTDFDKYLSQLFADDTLVHESMNYSLLARSKRIRPTILLSLLKDFGINEARGYACGAAIEMIHTYSLIHDDLPCFDDDDYRRGQPTNHKKYGESTAVLAGDGLLTEAFGVISNSDYTNNQKTKLISLLVKYSGTKGMIEGQSRDMAYEGKQVTLQQLFDMDALKTSCLITLPMQCALVLAEKEDLADTFEMIGRRFGIAFQVQDDILDVTASKEQLGKSASDLANEKSTYVSLMGLDEAKRYVQEQFDIIYETLGDSYPNFKQLCESVRKRSW